MNIKTGLRVVTMCKWTVTAIMLTAFALIAAAFAPLMAVISVVMITVETLTGVFRGLKEATKITVKTYATMVKSTSNTWADFDSKFELAREQIRRGVPVTAFRDEV